MADAPERVVIAVDGSEHSEKAFNYYVRKLHRTNYTVVCLHVADPPVLSGALIPTSADFLKKYNEQAEASLDVISQLKKLYEAKLLECEVQGKWRDVFSHKPGETIITSAKEEGATIIVMGTRGLGKVRRTLLGSVTEYVLHHSHCPVLICRDR